MKLKEWKDKKKKYHQKTIKECFSKEKPPPEAIQKELVFDQDFENKKQLADEKKNKKKWKNKKIENMNEGKKLWRKTKN